MALIEHFDVKGRNISALEVAQEISRTKTMFVVTVIASTIIVVVAALFVTMFA